MSFIDLNRYDARADRYMHIGAFPKPFVREVAIGDAPPFMRGLRALFVSDVHLRDCVSDRALSRLIEQMRETKADILLLGGDYSESERACERFFEALRDLDLPLGKYAAPGNNDVRYMELIERMAKDAGVTFLKNGSASIPLNGGTLRIGGCEDHRNGAPRTEGLFEEGGYRILLSHYPVMPESACELMLSGHTHAGQLALGRLMPYCLDFESELHMIEVRGLHRHGDIQVLVGNGIGTSILPLRIGARPEIYVLTFG